MDELQKTDYALSADAASNKKIAMLMGISLLVETVAFGLGDRLLSDASAGMTTVPVLLLQIASGASLLLAMAMFSLFKVSQPYIACGYISVRLVAFILIMMGTFDAIPLSSQGETHIYLTGYPLPEDTLSVVFYTGTLLFYNMLFITKIMPRFTAFWTLAGTFVSLVLLVCSLWRYDLGPWVYFPLALVSTCISIWLMIKGFYTMPLLLAKTEETSSLGVSSVNIFNVKLTKIARF